MERILVSDGEKKSTHIYIHAAADFTQNFVLSFVSCKSTLFTPNFYEITKFPKIFYVFQKHPHLEGSRVISRVQTPPLKITR